MSAIPGLSSTQAFLAIWAIRHGYRFLTDELLRPVRTVMWFFIPFIVWSGISGVLIGSQGQTLQLVNAFPVAVIAIGEYKRVSEQRKYLIILAIALACFLAVLPYWFHKVGLTFGASTAN